MIRIALDVAGGDHGCRANLEGVAIAIERGSIRSDQVVLVGRQEEIVAEAGRHALDPARLSIVDAPDTLDGQESPIEAIKRKPRNSIAVGIGLVKEGHSQAFVSAGNTGLVVATATLGLRCLEGVRRPGIAVTVRGEKGPFTIIDVGANPQPKAVHLLHYAIMGAAYARDALGIPEPRVGLMNIGSEDKKGNPLVREARDLLLQHAPNFRFVGNVEGVDVFAGACDVIVSDGFTGNVLLKVSEGCAEF
ncbi:MAG: phosphate acyltransferase, partial [Planctomycetes bacterium]|nr:phosphate acyltransferase [Planctomycetota bacterium]